MIDLEATIAAMKERGMSDADVLSALASLRLEAEGPTLTARQARNRRYYERKASEKRLKASEQDVSDATAVGEKESPQTPKEKQEPPTKEKTPKGVQKKASRLPSDFALPVEWHEWAVKRGLPPQRISVEFEKLTNWAANAPGSKGAKADWFRAWQNWVIGAIDQLPQNRAPPGQQAPTMSQLFQAIRDHPNENQPEPPEDRSSLRPAIPHLRAVGTG